MLGSVCLAKTLFLKMRFSGSGRGRGIEAQSQAEGLILSGWNFGAMGIALSAGGNRMLQT